MRSGHRGVGRVPGGLSFEVLVAHNLVLDELLLEVQRGRVAIITVVVIC